MKFYLVGGAVRDQLLGREVKEHDWVVIGATPDDMLALGYKPVGKDFPVFLHPDTQEEYALARTERKTARGYKGFVFNADPSVTLEEDLLRRDLTINAMAMNEEGKLVDLYGGEEDLKAKLLKHVSKAFAEDPVRILRIARFASRYPEFTIHPDTLTLMNKMSASGEVDALVTERVWKELSRALQEVAPERFFESLAACNALDIIFPGVQLEPAITALKTIKPLSDDGPTRFAAMLYHSSPEVIKRLKTPSDYQNIALLVVTNHERLETLDINDAEHIIDLLETLDCFRRPKRLPKFILACASNFTFNNVETLIAKLIEALAVASEVDAQPFVEQGLQHEAIGEALRLARIEQVRKIVTEHK